MPLPNPGMEPRSPASPASQADSLPLSHWGNPFSSVLLLICPLSPPLQHSVFTFVSGLFFILSILTWFQFSFPSHHYFLSGLPFYLPCWPSTPVPGSTEPRPWFSSYFPSSLSRTPLAPCSVKCDFCQLLSLSKLLDVLCCCLLSLDKSGAPRVVDISVFKKYG